MRQTLVATTAPLYHMRIWPSTAVCQLLGTRMQHGFMSFLRFSASAIRHNNTPILTTRRQYSYPSRSHYDMRIHIQYNTEIQISRCSWLDVSITHSHHSEPWRGISIELALTSLLEKRLEQWSLGASWIGILHSLTLLARRALRTEGWNLALYYICTRMLVALSHKTYYYTSYRR